MKQFVFSLVLATSFTLLFSCGNSNRSKAVDLANQIQKSVKENTPGTVATTADGYTMRAKVNGKEWVAKDMLPNDNNDTRRIFGGANGQQISFTIWMQRPEVGRKETFSDGNVAGLSGFEDVAIWGGKKGEAVVSKIDDNAIEGTFFITATSNQSDKTLEITDGFFAYR